MDIQIVREFVVLAEICSFQEAAESLNLSQSSLSKHIQRLESELGCSLFARSTRHVSLTPAGEIFHKYAKQIDEAYGSALNDLSELTREKNHVVTVRFVPALARYGVFDAVEAFNAAHPEIRVIVSEGQPEVEHTSFVVVQRDNPYADHPRFMNPVFRQDRLVAVFPEAHPLAGEPFVTVEQLRGERFVEHLAVQPDSVSGFGAFRELCRRYGYEPEVSGSSRYISNVALMVSRGYGCAVLYKNTIPDTPGIRLTELRPTTTLDICLSYPKARRLTRGEQLFLDYMLSLRDKPWPAT